MTRKRMSPATKHKLQLILIYLAAIVFCILWLADTIAIKNRIKQDEMKIQEYAQSTASSLELYIEHGNDGSWYDGAEYMIRFDALYSQYIEVRSSQRKFTKKPLTESERKCYASAHFIARKMIDDPDAMKPYAAELSSAMRQFGNRDPFSDKNMEFIAEKLTEICSEADPALP